MTYTQWVLRLISTLYRICRLATQKIFSGSAWKKWISAWKKVLLLGSTSIGTASVRRAESSLRKKQLKPYQLLQELSRRRLKAYYRPQKDEAFNPLRKYPRNSLCFCGSGIKFKKCHWIETPLFVKKKHFKDLNQLVAAARFQSLQSYQ